MLEETITRQNAEDKLRSRGSIKERSGLGPPVTFANPIPADQQSASFQEEVDAMNENYFDVVHSSTSPTLRRNTTTDKPKSGPQAAMVPQEQYDALKARFIENETATQKKLESINDLQKTIERRE